MITPTVGSADNFSEDFQNLSTVVAPSLTGCRAYWQVPRAVQESCVAVVEMQPLGATDAEHREDRGVGSSVALGQSVPRPGLVSAHRSQYGSSLPGSNSTGEPGEEKPPKI